MHKKRELSLRSGIVLGIILLILTGISLSGASVSAQGQSFSIAKDTTVPRTCPGSTLLLQSTVLSSAAQSFSLSQEGDAARFSISVPTGFILSAGGSKTLFSYVTPPSTTSPGTYRLKLFVNSASASASAEYNIVVEDCRAVSLNFEASSKSTCPGEVASYKAILRNIGRFTEDANQRLVSILDKEVKFEGKPDYEAILEDFNKKKCFTKGATKGRTGN